MSDSKPGSQTGPGPEADTGAQTCPVSGQGSHPIVERPPVADWRTDWDHLDPRWRDDPFPIWDELRTGPIAHTERFEGAWLPTRYEDVKAVAYDTEHFTSRRIVLRDRNTRTRCRRRRSPPTRRSTRRTSGYCCPSSRRRRSASWSRWHAGSATS